MSKSLQIQKPKSIKIQYFEKLVTYIKNHLQNVHTNQTQVLYRRIRVEMKRLHLADVQHSA